MRRFDKGPCYMEENDEGKYVLHSDHAAELAKLEDDYLKLNNIACEMRTRAERAEAYVAGQDEWSTFSTAEEMHAELVRVRTQRESICLAFNKALKANALLRAECEAWRKADTRHDWLRDNHACTHEVGDVEAAVFATDAAGILKGEAHE